MNATLKPLDRTRSPEPLRYREARVEDLADVALIEIENFYTPWSTADFKWAIGNEDVWFWTVLDTNDRVVANCLLDVASPDAQILTVSVRKSHQHLGIARRLIELMIEALEKSDPGYYENLFLEVRKSNEHAIALYEKLGFENVGVRKRYYDSPEGKEDAWVMQRVLARKQA